MIQSRIDIRCGIFFPLPFQRYICKRYMRRVLLLLLLLFAVRAHGQYDSVITYPNNIPKYLQTYVNGVLQANTYLSIMGDTMYKWDLRTATMTEYPLNGDYLTRGEFDSLKRSGHLSNASVEKIIQLNTMRQPMPGAEEWRTMHDVFYKRSPRYTLRLREGPFTIEVSYYDNERNGPFRKYYENKLVAKGNFEHNIPKGLWFFYPYHFYPYYDITVASPFDYDIVFYGPYGKQWSILYYISPIVIGIVLLIVLGKLAIRKDRYNLFYYIVLALAIVAIVLRLGIPYRRDIISIRYLIPAFWLVMWHGMLFLTTMNLFFGKRTNTRTIQNAIILLIGLACSIYVFFFKYLTF